jgi:hypothetical protein
MRLPRGAGLRSGVPKWAWGGAVFAALFLATAPAALAGFLDFGIIAPTAGTISYGGGATSLVGSGISVKNVVGSGVPSHNLVTLTCDGCVLAWTTNVHAGSPSWHWTGGPIALTGALKDGLTTIVPSGTLFSGTIKSADVSGTTSFKVDISSFTDTKNSDLAKYYGLPGGPGTVYDGNLNLSFFANATTVGNPFASDPVLSGDIVNTPRVPELPTALLLGTSILPGFALTALRRRRA